MPVHSADDELLRVLDVLALSSDPLFAINHRHSIVVWNGAMQRLVGYSYDEVVGRSCAGVLAGDDDFGNRYCSDACPVISIASRGDSVRQFRVRTRTKDAHFLTLDISVLKFVLKASNSLLLVHIVRPTQAQSAAMPLGPPRRLTTVAHADARVRELTGREIEILGLLAAGQSTRSIADHLCISPLTARNHIQHVFEKIEVHSKSEAVAFAYRAGLCDPAKTGAITSS